MIRADGDTVSILVRIEGGQTVSLDLAAARLLWSDLGRILNAADKQEEAAEEAEVAEAVAEAEEEVAADAKWPER
jgi:hypothetical protein